MLRDYFVIYKTISIFFLLEKVRLFGNLYFKYKFPFIPHKWEFIFEIIITIPTVKLAKFSRHGLMSKIRFISDDYKLIWITYIIFKLASSRRAVLFRVERTRIVAIRFCAARYLNETVLVTILSTILNGSERTFNY